MSNSIDFSDASDKLQIKALLKSAQCILIELNAQYLWLGLQEWGAMESPNVTFGHKPVLTMMRAQ